VETYVALLRAINVGGTGKLAMSDLRALCEGCGFKDVATYIQSGNVVFRSKLSEAAAKKSLERALAKKMGKPFGVMVRTGADLARVVADVPFPQAAPNQLLILFLDEAPPADSLKATVVPGREELALRGRELFIHFPDGMGKSKLKIPFQKIGTMRNLATTTKLAAMAPPTARAI
jgi:uncharacterized protein (DUF1697 family)